MLQDALTTLAARYGVADTLTGAVLLVDDEPGNLAVLREFLEDDYTVYEARSGREALRLAETTGFDVVIADHRMPEMTGVELLEALRAQRPDIAGILLTAYTDAPVLISAINRARVFRHLKKPWNPEEVLAAVAQASEHVHHGRLIARLVDLLARRTEELGAALEHLRAAQTQMLHLERLGTMGQLAAGITHDLRNTLQGLMLVEQHVATLALPEEFAAALRVGVADLHNLLGTLATINDFAAGERLTIAAIPVCLEDVVHDADAVAQMDLSYRSRNVVIGVAPGLPTIPGDPQKLVQVLVNLLRNALQATRESQTVRIMATREHTDAGDELVLAVEDEGPGVAPEVRERIFDAFVTTKGKAGMGMGLYMARLVAESHGGRMRYVDRPGGGARFEVRLPVPRAPAP